MDQQSTIPIHQLELEKAITFFMVPFYFETGEWDTILGTFDQSNRWQRTTREIYNQEDILYPYIMDVFKQHNATAKTRLDIYEFNVQSRGTKSDLFVDRILGKINYAFLAKNAQEKKNPAIIPFRLNTNTNTNTNTNNNYGPMLFISNTANIGVLTFSVELLGTKTLPDLLNFNYYCHKRDQLDSYKCVCIEPEKKQDQPDPIDANTLYSKIPEFWKQNQYNTRNKVEYLCWNFDDFVSLMLGTMGRQREGQRRIKYFTSKRMHHFTFFSIQDTADQVKSADLYPWLLRLSRGESSSYMLPVEQLVKDGAVLQTFENILFASSLEGTTMACIGKDANAAFISNIHSNFSHQYLVVYLLVLLQRYTLQSIERRISEFESTGKEDDEPLWELIDVICGIKVNCYYTDVSIYTHHSQFYQHCCRNLNIPVTFNEVGEKIELLKATTDRRMQQALNEQNALLQGQLEEHEKEIEAAERRQHLLNWIVAILTIAQVMQSTYELSKPRYYWDDPALYWSVGLGVLCAAILILVMWKDIKAFFKSIFTKKKKDSVENETINQ